MVDTEKINTRRLEREKMKNIMERKRKMTSPKNPISLIPHNIIINSNINEEEKEEGGFLRGRWPPKSLPSSKCNEKQEWNYIPVRR